MLQTVEERLLTRPGFERVARRRFPGGRREVQMASARFALRLLLAGLGVEPKRKKKSKGGKKR